MIDVLSSRCVDLAYYWCCFVISFVFCVQQALQGLKLSAQTAPLLKLLQIICDGNLDDFLAFKTANANVFTQNGLSASDVEQKVKVLTLSALGAQAADRVVSYAAISASLKIELEEVELWVIEAIAQNLVDATIDQINSSITFLYVVTSLLCLS